MKMKNWHRQSQTFIFIAFWSKSLNVVQTILNVCILSLFHPIRTVNLCTKFSCLNFIFPSFYNNALSKKQKLREFHITHKIYSFWMEFAKVQDHLHYISKVWTKTAIRAKIGVHLLQFSHKHYRKVSLTWLHNLPLLMLYSTSNVLI